MARLPTATVRALIALHFPANEVESGMRIAWRESNFDPTVHNENYLEGGRDNSYGLFQINMLGDLGVDRRRRWGILVDQMLFEPNFNVSIARKLWDENGGSWTGSQAWGSIPTTRNYPTSSSDDDNQTDPMTEEDWEVWRAMTDEERNFYENVPINSNPVPRAPGVTDREHLAATHWLQRLGIGLGNLSDVDDYLGNVPVIGDALQAVNRLIAVLMNPSFWKRIGLGILAAVVIVLAFVMFNKETIKGAVK